MSELIVVEHVRDNNFSTINLTNVQCRDLSWKAKGIFTYLLTRPSGWEINETDLIRRSNDGETSLRAGIRELQKKGYVYRAMQRNDSGKYKWKYIVCELPCAPDNLHPKILRGWEIVNPDLYEDYKKEEKKTKLPLSEDAAKFFEYWNSLPNVQKTRGGKSQEKAAEYFTLRLQKYSYMDICKIAKVYSELLDPKMLLQSPEGVKLKVGIADFFKPSKYARKKSGDFRSWFDECIPGKDPFEKYKKFSVESKFPAYEEAIKKGYIKYSGMLPSYKWKSKDEDQIRVAATKLQELDILLRRRIPSMAAVPRNNYDYFIDLLFKSILDRFPKVHIGNLCSDYTWNVIIPEYLKKQGINY